MLVSGWPVPEYFYDKSLEFWADSSDTKSMETALTPRPIFRNSGTYAYGPAESSRIRSTATKAEIERYENEHLIIPSGVEWTSELRKLSAEIHRAREAWDVANGY